MDILNQIKTFLKDYHIYDLNEVKIEYCLVVSTRKRFTERPESNRQRNMAENDNFKIITYDRLVDLVKELRFKD